jgi:hypothetical protein
VASASHPSIPLGYQQVTSLKITASRGFTAFLQLQPALTKAAPVRVLRGPPV